ncbi:hypothetical protein [Piscinibacter sp. XHJ-5]|uniref:hypothetical protein n=1 Tax=Piscinibacter sp. XHJ-5 TaxID=3037797 RepID=UPI002452DEAA|nr:hypothetical protein [Piscinibacter sp. XHJ-5]
MDINCSARLELSGWLAWLGLGPSNIGRAAAGVLIVLVLAACLALLRHQTKRLTVVSRADVRPYAGALHCLAPACWTLAVFGALLAAYFASGFYRKFNPDLIAFLNPRPAPLNHPAEMAARGVWAATFCAVLLGSIAVCWVGARVYWATACRQTTSILYRLLPLALVPVVSLLLLGALDLLPAFGSETSALMLCSTWNRNGLGYLGPTTDGLNVVAIAVVVVAATSFCLLRWGVHAATQATPAPLQEGSSRAAVRAFGATRLSVARDAHSIQALMDYALYAGAAALIAGLLEVVATLSWSFAPFQSSAELKVQADLCKAMQSAAAGSAPSEAVKKICGDVEQQLPMAATVDDLRKFTRSVGIMFGAVFSALLAAMYLPVALAQQELVDLLARTSPTPGERTPPQRQSADKDSRDRSKGGESARDPATLPLDGEPELNRSTLQRAFNVLAALGPLAAAIVSAVFGL